MDNKNLSKFSHQKSCSLNVTRGILLRSYKTPSYMFHADVLLISSKFLFYHNLNILFLIKCSLSLISTLQFLFLSSGERTHKAGYVASTFLEGLNTDVPGHHYINTTFTYVPSSSFKLYLSSTEGCLSESFFDFFAGSFLPKRGIFFLMSFFTFTLRV